MHLSCIIPNPVDKDPVLVSSPECAFVRHFARSETTRNTPPSQVQNVLYILLFVTRRNSHNREDKWCVCAPPPPRFVVLQYYNFSLHSRYPPLFKNRNHHYCYNIFTVIVIINIIIKLLIFFFLAIDITVCTYYFYYYYYYFNLKFSFLKTVNHDLRIIINALCSHHPHHLCCMHKYRGPTASVVRSDTFGFVSPRFW